MAAGGSVCWWVVKRREGEGRRDVGVWDGMGWDSVTRVQLY